MSDENYDEQRLSDDCLCIDLDGRPIATSAQSAAGES